MTEIQDKEKERKQWCDLLHAGWMFHQQMVKETEPTIIGDGGSDDYIFHKAVAVEIMDAINMIQQMEALGYFEEEDALISKPGPMG